MQAVAKLRFARLSAQKGRLVADQIRGLPVEQALNVLTFSRKKGAAMMKKLLDSAVANAENNEGADVDEVVGINNVDELAALGGYAEADSAIAPDTSPALLLAAGAVWALDHMEKGAPS